MIDRDIKRCLGQMMTGVQVVSSTHDGLTRAYTSHWVCQVSFEEPIIMASVSPKHDTYPLMIASGVFTVSILAGDQVEAGQYFSYPGRKFKHMADEYLEVVDDMAVVRDCVAWMRCEVIDRDEGRFDHDLFFARVVAVGQGRLSEPNLLYSARKGWRLSGEKAREPGVSVRDRLLKRLAEYEEQSD